MRFVYDVAIGLTYLHLAISLHYLTMELSRLSAACGFYLSPDQVMVWCHP